MALIHLPGRFKGGLLAYPNLRFRREPEDRSGGQAVFGGEGRGFGLAQRHTRAVGAIVSEAKFVEHRGAEHVRIAERPVARIEQRFARAVNESALVGRGLLGQREPRRQIVVLEEPVVLKSPWLRLLSEGETEIKLRAVDSGPPTFGAGIRSSYFSTPGSSRSAGMM